MDEAYFYVKLDISNLKSDNESLETVSFYLSYNYFPKVSSLIENLNTLAVDHVNNMIDHAEDSNAIERRIFALDNTDICSFTAVPNFTLNLTSLLLNILNLENTEQSNTARVPARLPTATRQQLYIHSNIVGGHLINNDEQQLLGL